MLQRYRLFKQKTFESQDKFEIRMNEECRKGWKIVNLACQGSGLLIVLLEREA
jgi:hypothetical protein